MRLRGRLFWQVYLHGLLMLAIVGIAVVLTGVASGRNAPWREHSERLVALLQERAAEIEGNPAQIARDLENLRELLGVEASIYRVDGSLVATNVEPAVAPLSSADLARLDGPLRLPRRPWSMAAPVRRDGRLIAYLAAGAPRHPPLTRAAAILASVLIALVIGSIPLARAIAAPLERLTEAAQRLGSGDLSTRARLEMGGEVGRLSAAFDEMAERIEALVRGEKELLANLSHELRTPLARIRVALEIAAEGDPRRAAAGLAEMGIDLQELERLVDDILTTARLDLAKGRAGEGVPPLRLEQVEPRELIGLCAERFRASHPGRVLELAVSDGVPALRADPALLRRAVDNLLDNAAKYSDSDRPVRLSARFEGGRVLVEVADRGIGMDSADLARVFEPFFRSDRSRARGTGGVGLGLALVRRIAEAHRGSVSLQSAPGEGTSVLLALPASPVTSGE